jgi:hypothetical protein
MLRRTFIAGGCCEIFADLRFELGKLHVLMTASTASDKAPGQKSGTGSARGKRHEKRPSEIRH